MSGSIPSRLVFLSDLPSIAKGNKVRFLGCVEKYEISAGALLLKHDYPRENQPVRARVNLDHIRESLNYTALEVGAWVNVVGYIQNGVTTSSATVDVELRDAGEDVRVQAILLWEAMSIRIDQYEKTLEARRE